MQAIKVWLSFTPLAIMMAIPLLNSHLAATEPTVARYTAPQDIDAAVVQFTGTPIGEIGGARNPTDRRLRLKACNNPLQTEWHGNNKQNIEVSCPDVGGWKIYVAARAAAPERPPERMVKRGDPITVIVRGRGFSVQQSGEALENGHAGEWIGIRTSRDASPIRAMIERPGLAIIPAG